MAAVESATRLTPRPHAWRLVQVGELLRRSHRVHEQALARLDRLEVGAALSADGTVVLSGELAGELEALGDTIAELAAQLQLLTSDLPDEPVEVGAAEAALAASDDLAAGILDEARLLLAARLLPAREGWPLLAGALRGADAHWEWGETSVARLLGGFRGVSAEGVEQVLVEAGISPHARLASCAPEQVVRLAGALERHCGA